MDQPTADLPKRNKSFVIKLVILLIGLLLAALIWRVGTAYYAIHTAWIKMNEWESETIESETIPLAERSPLSTTIVDKMIPQHDEGETEAEMKREANKIGEDAFSVLLLGIDDSERTQGRSDTMLVVTVNERLQSIQMVSIPRDSRVEIVGKQTDDKINHAYAYGGISMAIATVEQLLAIPIHYYVAINMEGFVEVVDLLGGVEVYNDMDLVIGDLHFAQGDIALYGREALAFSRSRHEDPRGDFGRQLRQRQLITAIVAKAATYKVWLHFDELIEVMGNRVKMNLKLTDLLRMQKIYGKASDNIEQIQFESGSGQIIDGVWYYILDQQELADITERLHAHLELVMSD